MSNSPKVRLSRLRDIGFHDWDPIGLLAEGETWDHKGFADEYDSYLLEAASLIRRGTPESEVVDRLVWVEVEHMGVGESGRADALRRARNTVKAILADLELWVVE